MFEKIGRKFVKGAKAELSDTSSLDWDKILHAAIRIAEAGLFTAVIFWSGKSESSVRTPTVIVNNYISKGE